MASSTTGRSGQAEPRVARLVPVERLRRRCDPSSFHFSSTAEVAPLDGTVGQPRAVSAISSRSTSRIPGTTCSCSARRAPVGGRRCTHTWTAPRASGRPRDWVYLFDMANPRRPIAVSFPAGGAAPFARDVARFVADAGREIARAFESDEYRRRVRVVASEVDERRQATLAAYRAEAATLGLGLEFTPAGILTLPVREGRPIHPDEFERLSPEEREAYRAHGHAVEERLPDVLGRLRALEREARERVATLDREVAVFAIGHLLDELRAHHGGRSGRRLVWMRCATTCSNTSTCSAPPRAGRRRAGRPGQPGGPADQGGHPGPVRRQRARDAPAGRAGPSRRRTEPDVLQPVRHRVHPR